MSETRTHLQREQGTGAVYRSLVQMPLKVPSNKCLHDLLMGLCCNVA